VKHRAMEPINKAEILPVLAFLYYFKKHTSQATGSRSWLLILKLVVCILLRVLGQVQGFRLTQHWNPEPEVNYAV
jgi:hypothetical protein